MNNSTSLLDELLKMAVELAAGAAARHNEGGMGDVQSKSSQTDPVTLVDQQSERLIVDGIVSRRPHDAIVGEEGADRQGTNGVRWIIDPLDGTVNYVYGYPMHAVSIGVEVDGVFSVGVVHHTIQPDRSGGQATHSEVVYAAKLGGGATRNGLPISCREPESLQATLLATGFGYDPEQRSAQAKVLVDLLPRVRDIRRSGSCALDLCSVASGVVDAFYETGPNIWDVAAGVVIVSEAGGTWSWDPDRGRILASSRQVWNEFDGAVSTAEEAATHIVQG